MTTRFFSQAYTTIRDSSIALHRILSHIILAVWPVMAEHFSNPVGNWRRMILRRLGVVGIAAVIFTSWVLLRYGLVDAARQHFAGRSLAATNAAVTVEGVPGGQAVAEFELRNVASVPVTIHGAETQCGCVALDRFPITVEAGAKLPLRLGVHVSTHENRESFKETVRLFTSPVGSPIPLEIHLRIAKRSTEPTPAGSTA